MRKIKRMIFNGLTVLSLLLCVATAGLWVRSYWISDEFRWTFDLTSQPIEPELSYAYFALATGRGSFGWMSMKGYDRARGFPAGWSHDRKPPHPVWTLPRGRALTIWDRLGFVHDDVWVMQTYTAPAWAIAALCACLPLIQWIGFLQRRRAARVGLCRRCGYDLCATPDRCPECGTIAEKTHA